MGQHGGPVRHTVSSDFNDLAAAVTHRDARSRTSSGMIAQWDSYGQMRHKRHASHLLLPQSRSGSWLTFPAFPAQIGHDRAYPILIRGSQTIRLQP
jgi:hypothetical protein